MFDDAVVAQLREDLRMRGTATLTDARGGRLILVNNRLVNLDKDGIVVAYEGEGTFIFEVDRPLNPFRLVSAGFSLETATAVAELLNRITESPRPGTTAKALSTTQPE